MGKKGGVKHLSRIAAHPFAAPGRKTAAWLAKPVPGRHKAAESVALLVLVRDFMGFARDAREAERIIKAGEIMIDGKVEKNPRMCVGLMDVVTVPKAGKSYYVLMDSKGRIRMSEVGKEKAGRKLCKITGKRTVKKGAVQLSLHDGRTLMAGNSYKVGDSVVVAVPGGKIVGNYRLEPGARCLIMKGRHAGTIAKLKEVTKGSDVLEPHAKLDDNGREVLTVKKYLFAVGDEI